MFFGLAQIGCAWIFLEGLHLQLLSLVHECFTTLLGAERSLEVIRMLVSRYRSIKIVKSDLSLPLLLLFLSFPSLE